MSEGPSHCFDLGDAFLRSWPNSKAHPNSQFRHKQDVKPEPANLSGESQPTLSEFSNSPSNLAA
jgi:hypothetical protein